jgi:predicted glycosyltransferase
MGGYNTFCEVLSFDKRALVIPRTEPRMEQHIRASRAEALGLVRMLTAERMRDPARMAAALRGLATQNRPSEVVVPGLLEGLDNIRRLVRLWTESGNARRDAAREARA